MKIIHCVGRLKGGGAETQLQLLVENGSKAIQNVVVSYDKKDNMAAKYYQIDESWSIINKWKKFYSICKTEQPDAIHIWLPAIFHVYCVPACFVRVPKLLGVRNAYQLDSLKRFLHLIFYMGFKNMVSNTHLENHRGIFKIIFKRKKYHTIPNAIKFDLMPPTLRRKQGLFNKHNLLFVGRLVKQKNIPFLLSALTHLSNENWRLTIVGKGQEKEKLVQLARKLKIDRQIIFKEFTDTIETYYQNSDILVLPSFMEGMPNVVFEAAVFDTVLILSDIPQHKRWFTHQKNAFLFNPQKPEELAACIETAMAMHTQQKKEMFSEAHKVLSGLTKEKYIERYTNLYKRIINE